MHVAKANLHPNMYLLIRARSAGGKRREPNLHPNMYLLIPAIAADTETDTEEFTSQHVSINSGFEMMKGYLDNNLHPNMYLLIQQLSKSICTILSHLHPNMYLLIHVQMLQLMVKRGRFTSQHVSINSGKNTIYKVAEALFTSQHVSINSFIYVVTVTKWVKFTSQHVSINSHRRGWC